MKRTRFYLLPSSCLPQDVKHLLRPLLASALEEPLVEGASMWLVARPWWSACCAWVNDGVEGETTGAQPPGPIDNSLLLAENSFNGIRPLLPMLADGLDYVLVGEDMWRALSASFGVLDQHQELRREIVSDGSAHAPHPVVEVYPLVYGVSTVADTMPSVNGEIIVQSEQASMQQTVELSKKSTVGKLLEVYAEAVFVSARRALTSIRTVHNSACVALGIDLGQVECRLWAGPTQDSYHDFRIYAIGGGGPSTSSGPSPFSLQSSLDSTMLGQERFVLLETRDSWSDQWPAENPAWYVIKHGDESVMRKFNHHLSLKPPLGPGCGPQDHSLRASC